VNEQQTNVLDLECDNKMFMCFVTGHTALWFKASYKGRDCKVL